MKIKNVKIGEGTPKIVVSFVGNNLEEVRRELAIALQNKDKFDIIEIRGDSFETLSHEDHIECVNMVINELTDVPILYTYRTIQEGGKGSKSAAEYEALLAHVIEECNIDIIDIEFFKYEDIVDHLVKKAKDKDIAVLLSVHDMEDTPHFEEMMATYQAMIAQGGEILKIAYMPKNGRDVLSVLSAVHDARQAFDVPVVGISMGDTGRITRLAGGVFGSCLMYSYLEDAAAEGQVDAYLLKQNLSKFD